MHWVTPGRAALVLLLAFAALSLVPWNAESGPPVPWLGAVLFAGSLALGVLAAVRAVARSHRKGH